jgi:hypothetical protein
MRRRRGAHTVPSQWAFGRPATNHLGVNPETPRARIADIIRASGAMGGDRAGASPEQLAALASAIGGTSGATLQLSEALSEEVAKRFPKFASSSSAERDFAAPYETAGRAAILALQACALNVTAAFDTESGAALEVKKPMSLLVPAFTLAITLTDRGDVTHVSGQAQHTGLDWGQNAKLLNQFFDKTNEYLARFET